MMFREVLQFRTLRGEVSTLVDEISSEKWPLGDIDERNVNNGTAEIYRRLSRHLDQIAIRGPINIDARHDLEVEIREEADWNRIERIFRGNIRRAIIDIDAEEIDARRVKDLA
jgi:hypothetical protein